jgi:hypothetical protein
MFYSQLDTAYPSTAQEIPKSKLGYSTNNVYDGYPPLMNDGRSIVASFQPEAVLNNQIIKENGIKTNWQYRKFLTENANHLMKENYRESSNDFGYMKRYNTEPSTTSPFLLNTATTANSSLEKQLGYQTSDLKELYLSREKLDSQRVAPAFAVKKQS